MTGTMTIRIDEELRAYIDPLTPDEYAALEQSLLAEGCRDALVLWGDLLIDGHNRHAICSKHGIAFNTVQNTRLRSMDDVRLWMIDNHLGRRSVSDFQRGVLALRKKEILESRRQAGEAEAGPTGSDGPAPAPLTRQTLARQARLSSTTLGQIEKIRQQAAPELVRAVQSGEISINAAAAVATLPAPQQAAAAAGGRSELRAAARQVREARLPVRRVPEGEAEPAAEPRVVDDYPAEVARLDRLVAQLAEERDALKKKVVQLTVALAEARARPGD
ncbi:hypothetical protein QCN28_10015 [Bordetella bronchiseptica]|uniref:Plasmid replication/partition related protein n=2 Tax=Bordetella TaxID=517 RepID=A0ABX4FDE1_9BORD|nr:hypothetical protein [Bordetella genomosp. 6]OZI78571.1 hypothetical protein CAL23_12130 [Bordetella genomosp. 6]